MIGDLWARLAVRPDRKSFARADTMLRGATRGVNNLEKAVASVMLAPGKGSKVTEMLRGNGAAAVEAKGKVDALGGSLGSIGRIAAVATAAFGFNAAKKALIDFNATTEETKLQIAGMLALTKKTDLAPQLKVADTLFANLQRRAASLPGTTQEYTQMLGALAQPISDAGLGLKDLEDLTVNAVVGAKAFGIGWEVAARDIDQALRGQFHSIDQFSGKILGGMGFKGEEGRSRFNAKSQQERAAILKQALLQKQITQLSLAQGQTFRGVLSTLQDAIQQFFGRVGKPIFEAMTESIKTMTAWLDENKEKIQEVANTIGKVLIGAFEALRKVIKFLMGDTEEAKALLRAALVLLTALAGKMALAWIRAAAPVLTLMAAISAGMYLFEKLRDVIGEVGAAIVAAFSAVAIVKMTAKVRELGATMLGLNAAAAATAGGSAMTGAGVAAAAGAGKKPGMFGKVLGVAGTIAWPLAIASTISELTGGEAKTNIFDPEVWAKATKGEDLVAKAPTTTTNEVNMSFGDIKIQAAPGADAQQQAEAFRKAFSDMFDSQMRKAVL